MDSPHLAFADSQAAVLTTTRLLGTTRTALAALVLFVPERTHAPERYFQHAQDVLQPRMTIHRR